MSEIAKSAPSQSTWPSILCCVAWAMGSWPAPALRLCIKQAHVILRPAGYYISNLRIAEFAYQQSIRALKSSCVAEHVGAHKSNQSLRQDLLHNITQTWHGLASCRAVMAMKSVDGSVRSILPYKVGAKGLRNGSRGAARRMRLDTCCTHAWSSRVRYRGSTRVLQGKCGQTAKASSIVGCTE